MLATCSQCGSGFEAKRSSAKYCTRACSARATRRRAAGKTGDRASAAEPRPATSALAGPALSGALEDPRGGVSLLVAATIDELARAGRLGTVLGQAALVLAQKAGSVADTGSATASVIRQLQATLAAALAGGEQPGDPVDEVDARRRAKASRA